METELEIMKFKSGQIFKAIVPYCEFKPQKVHIDHVLPSFYENQELIIFRVWKRNKPWWHEFMCTNHQMEMYIETAQKYTFKKTTK